MTLRRRLLRLAWTGPVALGVCYFALWACAPLLSSPAPVPIPQARSNQLGVGTTLSGDLPGLTGECWQGQFLASCSGFDFKAYYRHKFEAPLELNVEAHGGFLTIFGAGVQVRGYFIDNEPFRMGLTGGLGWAYLQAGLPIAGQVAPNLWLYTEPMVSATGVGLLRAPIGLAFTPGITQLDIEGGVATGVGGVPFAYGGLGVGFAF